MSSLFTTEIGRMRSEEMIARGLRYQEVEAAKRRQERLPVAPNFRRSILLRGPVLASASALVLFAASFGIVA